MNHYGFISLDEGLNSVAYYCKPHPKTLIIFVHGFTGKSVSTWLNFTPLLLQDASFHETDILFYGYDSYRGQAFDQSLDFFDFLLKNHSPNTKKLLRHADEPYDKILIVGHSLGSIISRFAVLTAINSGQTWIDSLRILLFAPAHNGARIHKLITENLSSTAMALKAGFSFAKPILEDLSPNSSCIKQLKEETERYRDTPYEKILKAKTVFAFGDKIVNNLPFCFDDTTTSLVRSSSHSLVCKPNSPTYLIPIEVIKASI